MAEGKKSVLLYCDIIHTVEKLSNEQAGELFKHYLRYVNDLNPVAENPLTEIVFEPIRQSLKRDLIKYGNIVDRNKKNGAKGGRPTKPKKPTGLIGNPKEPKKADSDSDSDSVRDKVINIPTFDNFKNHADSKNLDYNKTKLRLKYDSWVENGWKNGNDKPLVNWKASLTNTLPFILNEQTDKPSTKMKRTW